MAGWPNWEDTYPNDYHNDYRNDPASRRYGPRLQSGPIRHVEHQGNRTRITTQLQTGSSHLNKPHHARHVRPRHAHGRLYQNDSGSDTSTDDSYVFDDTLLNTSASHKLEGGSIPSSSQDGATTTAKMNGGQHGHIFKETQHRVFHSRYIGDDLAQGDIVAELITEQELVSKPKQGALPLMQWM